jgi:hypothetical protein
VLEAADRLGWRNDTFIGFCGTDDQLEDVGGPRSMAIWTTSDCPTKVRGVAVDRRFVDGVASLLEQNATTVVYAQMQLEHGPFNNLAASNGFRALRIIVDIALVIVILYGSYHFVKPLVQHTICAKSHDDCSITGPTPFQRAYWFPDVSTIMRLICLYCLTVWFISWPYKTLIPWKYSLMYSATFAAIAGFCLMIYRWCRIVKQVRDHTIYKVLHYWSMIEIVIAFEATLVSALIPVFPYDSYRYFRMVGSNYVLQPTLAMLLLLFTITSFTFLKEMKRIALQQQAYGSLKKITIIGLYGLGGIIFYLLSMTVNGLDVGDDLVRYMVLLVIESSLWISNAAIVFYLLSVDVPRQANLQPNGWVATHDTDYRNASSTLTQNEEGSASPQQQEESDKQKWNDIMLHGLVRSPTDRKRRVYVHTASPAQHGLQRLISQSDLLVEVDN